MQYGGGIRVGVPLSQSVTLLGAAEYYKFTLDKEGISNDYNTQYLRDIWIFQDVGLDASAGPSSVMTYSVNLRVAPVTESWTLAPYFIGGVGAMHVTLSEIDLKTASTISFDSSDVRVVANQKVIGGSGTAMFFQLGLGLDARVAQRLDMFIEARYAAGFNAVWGTAYTPITAGVAFRL
jgi:hypothetical protein